MSTLYAPGSTPVAVTPRGFAVLEDGASAALLARIKSLVAEGRGLGGVIEALTGAYGASITALPAFAVAIAEGEAVRVAVRGEFAVEVHGVSSERITGAGVTTWTERVLPGASRVALTARETDASAPAEFEITDGIVFAAAIEWDPEAADPAPTPLSAPATRRTSSGATPAVPPTAPTPPTAPVVPTGAADAADTPADAPAAVSASAEPAKPEPAEPEPVEPEPAPAEREPLVGPRRGRGEASAAPTSVPAAAPSTPGLIDSRTVQSIADAETLLPDDSALGPRDEAPAPAEPADADPAWATVMRPGQGAAAAQPSAPAPGVVRAGDHDGETISLAQARAMRGGAATGALPVDSTPAPLAPPRPPAPGRVRVSTGQTLPLDRTVVIGRRPRSTRVSGTDLPHLVAVDSPQQDISRSHVELRVEGESIVATDLRTTNGTTLLRAGADPVRLHPGEATVVVFGDVLDLGDGITVTIEAPA